MLSLIKRYSQLFKTVNAFPAFDMHLWVPVLIILVI